MATWLELPDLPIRITETGAWLHGDAPLHPRVADLFARHVVPSSEGAYEIVLGRNRHRVEVADTAYFVRGLSCVQGANGTLQTITLRLSDGMSEPLAGATLMQSEHHIFYCRLLRHGLWVPCRFAAHTYHELALFMVPHGGEDDARFALPLGGAIYPVMPYVPMPQAALMG